MKNQTILFTILVFAIFQCSSYNQQTDKCEVYNAKSARCEVKYDLTNDIAYIDSALYYINEIFDECEQYQTLLGLRKVSLYSIKNEYLNSIKYLDTLIAKEIITQFYKNVLTNRFNAMQAQYNGDTINKRKYIQQAFNEVEQFYILNKSKIDSFLNIPYITAYEANELNYKLNELQEKYLQYNFVLLQYYYYKTQIQGLERVKLEIDSLQNAVNGDDKYFEILRITIEEDFMRFIGL